MGQTMLVIGALTMLATLTMSINGTFITAISTGLEAQAQLNALSIAQTLLDEILARDFDEVVTEGELAYADSEFTTTANFGPETGETLTAGLLATILGYSSVDTSYQSKDLFDDVDDYDGYERAVQDSVLGWFYVTSSVSYASETSPDSLQSDRTHYKVVTVTVTHPNLPTREVEDSPGVYVDEVIPITLKDIAIYRRYF